MARKVIIRISLVDESAEKTNKEIVDEIFDVLSEGNSVIPWCKKSKESL